MEHSSEMQFFYFKKIYVRGVTIIFCTRQFSELDVERGDIATKLCKFLHDQSKLLRRPVTPFTIQSIVRIIMHQMITRYAIRRRSITWVSPLIRISQDCKKVRARRKEKTTCAAAKQRAWVPARYDAIMRYKRARSLRGNRASEKKRQKESDPRTRRKEVGRGDGEEGEGRESRMVLPHWPWLGPKLRWVEMLPGPLVASPSPTLTFLWSSLLRPAALRVYRQAPPGLPCSSAFADSSIKDITKSTLDENTLPLCRGVPRERRAKTLCLS